MLSDKANYFKGTFDGQGYSISGLKIESGTNIKGDIGLFGYVNNATIKNLTLSISSLTLTTAGKSIGGLVGSSSGSLNITNCIVMNGSISTSNTTDKVAMNVGGLIGYCDSSSGKIEQCANYTSLTNGCYGTAVVGGIAGKLATNCKITINKCYSEGNITAGSLDTASTFAGGIAGKSETASCTISHCQNNAYITAKSDITGGYDTSYACDATGNLRDTDGVKIQYAKRVRWDNSVKTIKAGGIIGDGAKCNVQYCVNSKSTNDVYNSYYYDYVDYFYGYVGESFGSGEYKIPCEQAWFGDYINIKLTQTILNFREIGFNTTTSTCYSYSAGDYYNKKTELTEQERLYRAKITGANKDGVTASALALTETVEDPNTSIAYIRETSKSGSTTIKLPVAYDAKVNKLITVEYPANYCDDTYFYLNGKWVKGNVYNLYSTTVSAHQLGLSTVYVSNHNNIGQLYGIYNSNWMSGCYVSGNTLYIPKGIFNTQNLGSSENTHYQIFQEQTISCGATYTSYFNTRFVNSDNDGCPDRYHKNSKSIIKNNKITLTSSNNIYTFTHNYSYDYKSSGWKTTSTSNDIGTATDRTIDNTKQTGLNIFNDSTIIADTSVAKLNENSSNTWIVKNNTPTLKWMNWEDTLVKIPSYKITLNLMGGSIKGNNSNIVNEYVRGTVLSNLPKPIRAGYTFTGWSKTKTISGLVSTIIVKEDQTYYAIWKKNGAIIIK